MAVKAIPQVVADAFVKQYYTILNRCPENLHRFYGESSLLCWPVQDGKMTPVTTLSGINDKVMSSNYKNCTTEVNTVDAQASQDGAVIVSVTGSFIDKDDVEKLFFQTFFLATQERGFFVLNDILRVFDARGSSSAVGADAPVVPSSVAGNNSDSVTPSPSSPSKAANETVNEEAHEAPVASVEKALSPVSNEKALSVVTPASKAKEASVITPPLNVAPKFSYASVVAKEASVTSPKSEKVTPKSNASPGDSFPKLTTTVSSVVSKVVAKLSTGANSESQGADKSSTGGYSAKDTSVRPDARGIYVGRLPYDITKQGVVDVIKQFGTVRRQSDAVQIRRYEDGFCCGFVEFESADSARRAVEAHHVMFGDMESYIAYKRSSYNRGGPRSPTRGGFRNGNENRSQRSRSSGQQQR